MDIFFGTLEGLPIDMSGSTSFGVSPATPLEPHLASPNRVLGSAVCETLPRYAFGFPALQFCFAI